MAHDWSLLFLVFVMGFTAGAVLHPIFLQFLERYVEADDRKNSRTYPLPLSTIEIDNETNESR